jgi:hypothetical protein
MRELGMRKVSFWLSERELRVIKAALGRWGGKPGRKARELLTEWGRVPPGDYADGLPTAEEENGQTED